MNTKTDYWFSLASHVYVEFKTSKMLLYNTKTGISIESSEKEVILLVSELYEPKNLGAIFLNKELQACVAVQNFIKEVLEKQMGDLIELSTMPQKPISLLPILNLQRDVERLKKSNAETMLLSSDTIHYLLELNIYLNDSCHKKCTYCKEYCKQLRCCTANQANLEISVELLENIFQQIDYSPIGRINLLGGNISEYKNAAQLLKIFSSLKDIMHGYIFYDSYKKTELTDALQIELIVNFPVNEQVFADVCSLVDKQKSSWHFIVTSEEDYWAAEKLSAQFGLDRYAIKPFYTAKNLDFFREHIFMSKEDIFSQTVQMREIFRNQKLNANNFGILYILTDGSVKANINTSVLGNIKTKTILDLIYKELLENTAWRKIRDKQPCSNCIYQFICPSPSDYEKIIGMSNFCHIIK
jgi:pseudo-rSAM protein